MYGAHKVYIALIVLFQINSVRQTIIVIGGYIICSIPAVGIKMWGIFMNKTDDMTGNLIEALN